LDTLARHQPRSGRKSQGTSSVEGTVTVIFNSARLRAPYRRYPNTGNIYGNIGAADPFTSSGSSITPMIFRLMFFVVESLILHRWLLARSQAKPTRRMAALSIGLIIVMERW
jgi:hypothetical protein